LSWIDEAACRVGYSPAIFEVIEMPMSYDDE